MSLIVGDPQGILYHHIGPHSTISLQIIIIFIYITIIIIIFKKENENIGPYQTKSETKLKPIYFRWSNLIVKMTVGIF